MTGYTDSSSATTSLSLLGVWIHDPLDAEGTVRNYLYGRSSRSTSIEVEAASLVYAGRTYQVTEYGEHQRDEYSVSIDVPHGETWASDLADLEAFAEARRTLCFRDNRGRQMFGTLSGYGESDEDGGTAVRLTFSRVDYDESVA